MKKMEMRKSNNYFDKLITIFKKIKVRNLLLLILLLGINSYAWFIYATKVSGSLTAHVTSWNVEFAIAEGDTSTNIDFDVDKIYPGMPDYSKTIIAHNKGEMKAKLEYEIQSMNILGHLYEINEITTSQDLLQMIENDFPFQIQIILDNGNLEAGNGEGSITVTLKWPFESGNDELDTKWGQEAYDFYASHATEKSIHIVIKVTAVQL